MSEEIIKSLDGISDELTNIQEPLNYINSNINHQSEYIKQIKDIFLNKNLDINNQEFICQELQFLENKKNNIINFKKDYNTIQNTINILNDYSLDEYDEIKDMIEKLKISKNKDEINKFFTYENIIDIISKYTFNKFEIIFYPDDDFRKYNCYDNEDKDDNDDDDDDYNYNIKKYFQKNTNNKNIIQYFYNDIKNWSYDDNLLYKDELRDNTEIYEELNKIINQKEKENKQPFYNIGKLIESDTLPVENDMEYIDFSKELKIIYKIIKLQNKIYNQITDLLNMHQNIIFQLDKLERKIKKEINEVKKELLN